MTWIIGDPEEEEFISQLASFPDRIVGLLAPAIIDKRLATVIKARWANTSNGELLQDLFRDGGPLGSFATRIQIGFAIRIYGEDTYKDLRAINKIRNDFAHRLSAKDFNTQGIRDRANKLLLPARFPTAPSDTPVVTEAEGDYFIFRAITDMTKHSLVSQGTDARNRVVRTIEILAIMLWAEDYFARSTGIPHDALPPMPRF